MPVMVTNQLPRVASVQAAALSLTSARRRARHAPLANCEAPAPPPGAWPGRPRAPRAACASATAAVGAPPAPGSRASAAPPSRGLGAGMGTRRRAGAAAGAGAWTGTARSRAALAACEASAAGCQVAFTTVLRVSCWQSRPAGSAPAADGAAGLKAWRALDLPGCAPRCCCACRETASCCAGALPSPSSDASYDRVGAGSWGASAATPGAAAGLAADQARCQRSGSRMIHPVGASNAGTDPTLML